MTRIKKKKMNKKYDEKEPEWSTKHYRFSELLSFLKKIIRVYIVSCIWNYSMEEMK